MKARCVMLVALLLLGGCKAGPDYIPPGACVPSEWNHDLPPNASPAPADPCAWWTRFNDPVLNTLVEQSVRQNLSLREATSRIYETRALRGVARGGLFPDINSDTNYQRIKISNNGNAFGFPVNRPAFDFWTSGFDASWEIDLFGAVRRNIEAADADIGAAVEARRAATVTLLGDVAANYVQLRVLQSRAEWARQNAQLQKQTLEIAESRLEEGEVSKLDPLQARSNWKQTRAALPDFARQQDEVVHRLCALQSRPPRDLIAEIGCTATVPLPPTDIAIGLPVDLVRRRPDIRRAERELAAESARIGVATADLYPRLSLTGSFSYQAADIRQWVTPNSVAYRLSPAIRWNLLNFGRVRNAIDAQQARYEQAVARYCQQVVDAVEEVENAIAGLVHHRERVEELSDAVEAAREAAEIAELRYREGQTGFQPLLDAQRVLTTLRDQLAAAEGDTTLSAVALYKALGGGWG